MFWRTGDSLSEYKVPNFHNETDTFYNETHFILAPTIRFMDGKHSKNLPNNDEVKKYIDIKYVQATKDYKQLDKNK